MKLEIMLNRDYYHVQHDIIKWCTDTYGPINEKWGFSSLFGHSWFEFTDEKDYNWFLLKWKR